MDRRRLLLGAAFVLSAGWLVLRCVRAAPPTAAPVASPALPAGSVTVVEVPLPAESAPSVIADDEPPSAADDDAGAPLPDLSVSDHGHGELYVTAHSAYDPPLSLDAVAHARVIHFLKVDVGRWIRPLVVDRPALHEVTFTDTTHTNAAIRAMRGASVERVSLAHADVDDTGLGALVRLPSLARLRLCSVRVTDAGVARLASLAALQSLEVCGDVVLDGSGVARLPQLRGLSVRGASWAPEAYGRAARAPALERLDVDDRSFGRPHLAALAPAHLRRLAISRSALHDDDLDALDARATLTALTLCDDAIAQCAITDAGLARVAKLPALEELVVVNAKGVTDAGMTRVAALPALRTLNARFAAVTDAGARTLATKGRLESLDLWGTQITDAGLEAIADLQELRELSVGYTRATNAGARSVARLPKLEVLYGSLVFGDDGVRALGPLHALRELHLVSSDITARGFEAIATHEGLERLDVGCGKVRGRDVAPLVRLTKLKELYLDCQGLDDEAIPFLSRLTQLEHLNVVPTSMSDAGRKRLYAALPGATLL
jgi:hypothetical protein